MPFLRRRVGLSLLALVLLVAPLTVLAQDDTVRIDGSRIVADVIAPVIEALESDVNLEISGSNNGLARLCNGEIDIATVTGAITREQEEACAANDIAWVEVPVGYDALAVVSNPAITTPQCITFPELSTLFGPAASGTVTALNRVNVAWGTAAIQAYAPAADSAALSLLDSLLPGDGLRTDFTTEADPAALLGAVATTEGALGIAPLATVLNGDAVVNAIALDDLSGNGCVDPGADTLADGTYPGARAMFLYVNAASLERANVQSVVDALVGEDGQTSVADSGFVALGTETVASVIANIADGTTGRQFSQAEPLYSIPLDVAGTVLVESAADAFDGIKAITDGLTRTYASITATLSGFGNAAAYRNLCTGAADVAAVTRAATAEEAALCEENGVTLWEAPLGARALVMVVGSEAEYAACLTTAQVTDLWKAEGGVAVTNWNALGAGFPDLPVTVFLPLNARNATDFLLTTVSDTLYDGRRDALEQRADALWRTAATANVEGAITYMTLDEYLRSDAEVMAVAVDAGEGCVAPSAETILDGSYAVSKPVTLVIRSAALARPEVQALAWYATRSGADLLASAAFTPGEESAFAGYQEALIAEFAAAEAIAAAEAEAAPAEEAAPEPTPTSGG